MRIGIIIGSHRKESQSSKIGKFIEEQIKNNFNEDSDIYTLNLADFPIPLWSEAKWENDSELQKQWKPFSDELSLCEGFVIISPEWNGMVPPGLKNLFLFCDGRELAHKPALPVTVSAGYGGSYPISELRMSGFKNTMISYIPGQVIVRFANQVLNSEESQEDNDVYIRNRISYELSILEEYVKAYRLIRENAKFDFKKYPFGM